MEHELALDLGIDLNEVRLIQVFRNGLLMVESAGSEDADYFIEGSIIFFRGYMSAGEYVTIMLFNKDGSIRKRVYKTEERIVPVNFEDIKYL